MSEWISVYERLPVFTNDKDAYSKEYLVVCRTKGGMLPEGYFQSTHKAQYHFPLEPDEQLLRMGIKDRGYTGYWELIDGATMDVPFDVVAWMEIPEVKE